MKQAKLKAVNCIHHFVCKLSYCRDCKHYRASPRISVEESPKICKSVLELQREVADLKTRYIEKQPEPAREMYCRIRKKIDALYWKARPVPKISGDLYIKIRVALRTLPPTEPEAIAIMQKIKKELEG